jgi:hypothetical protein
VTLKFNTKFALSVYKMKTGLRGGKRNKGGELPGPGEGVISQNNKGVIHTAADT